MFNNRKDPLIDSVKKVMEENELRRQAELDLNEELGIASKRALPHEHHANYDALLEQKIAEALHPNQQKLDVHEPEKDKLTSQDFKLLRAKKGIKEAIGDKEGTAGTLRKNGKPFVPDTLANSPFMQASPDKAPMPPERPKDLDKQAPTPPARPKDLNEISRNLARQVIRKASDEKEMGSKKDRSKAVELAGKKAYSIPSEPKVRATNEESLSEENHVLYSHPKADIKVVRKGEGSKEGAAIEVHKGGKKVASGDYDHGADAFFVNVGGKGQKSFDTAKDIANHFHGLSEQFQQIDEMAPKGAKYERMVKHIKDKYSKDGKLSDKEKSIAYATAWKAKNKNMEEGLTAEQVMAEIRKNLGEAKMKKIEEADKADIDPEAARREKEQEKQIANPTPPGTPPETRPQPPATTAQSGQPPRGPDSTPSRLPTFATGTSGTPSVTRDKPAEPPKVSSNADIEKALGNRGPQKVNDLPPPASSAPSAPKPAAPATPSAPKPAAPKPAPTQGMTNNKNDIWDDSKIQRTGPGGEETAADFQRNSELYKQRIASGGQRPENSMTNQGSQTRDAMGRPGVDKPGTARDTVGRPTDKRGSYTRASQTPSNEVGSPANDTVGTTRSITNRTPANQIYARKTKPETKPTAMNESLNDTITKILKG